MEKYNTELARRIAEGAMDQELTRVYGYAIEHQRTRYSRIADKYTAQFNETPGEFYSAPGRSEIVGNHTDHQHGCVVAASINMDIVAAIKKRSDLTVRLFSEGFGLIETDLSDLDVDPSEAGTTSALIKGVAYAFKNGLFSENGEVCEPFGFDAYVESDVPAGSGVSSSAAFEVLIGNIFCGDKAEEERTRIAQIGQFAENKYFGKPSGLMDQLASSLGGVTFMDFRDPAHPETQSLAFDVTKAGYNLCIIDTHSSHADLTPEYAAITHDMKAVAAHFGKEVLRDVDPEIFYNNIKELRELFGDRTVLRCLHFYEEINRVLSARDALNNQDAGAFLEAVNGSGRSSFAYLQNIYATGSVKEQGVAVALGIAEKLLGGRGALRVHGGGFAGTIMAFVPTEMTPGFKTEIEKVLGEGSCRVMKIRKMGGARLKI